MKLTKALCWAGVLVLHSQMVMAEAWQEREILSRVREQLIRVNKLLDEAQHAGANSQSRLRMEYGSIRQDLTTIERGIEQYISTPMEPAAIAPLDGGYTDYQQAQQLPRPLAGEVLTTPSRLPQDFKK